MRSARAKASQHRQNQTFRTPAQQQRRYLCVRLAIRLGHQRPDDDVLLRTVGVGVVGEDKLEPGLPDPGRLDRFGGTAVTASGRE
jgi:hypothetical protein